MRVLEYMCGTAVIYLLLLFFFRYGLWHCVQLSDKAENVFSTAALSAAPAAFTTSLAILAEALAIFV